MPTEIRQPLSGGTVRWLVGSEVEAKRALVASTALPLVGFGPFAGVAGGDAILDPDPRGCFRLAPDPALRGGGAEEVVGSWRAAIASAGPAIEWLSDPLGGVTGWQALDDQVVICPSRPTPDLAQRLRHPAAWIRFPTAEDGPGPFLEAGSGRLVRNPGFGPRVAFLDRVELVPRGETDAALWVRLGEVDLALLYGEAATGLRENPDADWVLRRIPEWDRVYFLVLDPQRRWTMDPSFRHWLSRTIDREGLLRYALSGAGEPAFTLSRTDGPPPRYETSRPPFGQGSRPHLSLGFDGSDPLAVSIAARVQSALELEGVEIEGVPRAGEGERREVALFVHLPPTEDPVLALWQAVESAGAGGPAVERLLDQASRLPPGQSRRDAAWMAEDALLLEGHVVPLVRLHAWLAVRRGLRDVEVTPGGLIALQNAWWQP